MSGFPSRIAQFSSRDERDGDGAPIDTTERTLDAFTECSQHHDLAIERDDSRRGAASAQKSRLVQPSGRTQITTDVSLDRLDDQ